MKQRPILFSAPMVRALLDGSKTQTRRIVKPAMNLAQREGGGFTYTDKKGTRWMCGVGGTDAETIRNFTRQHSPYGQPGDRLWVREAFRFEALFDSWEPRAMSASSGLWHEANGAAPEWMGKLRPSMFMPRWASRITLEITRVRVERLQAISEADARAEGVIVNRDTTSSVPYGVEIIHQDERGAVWSDGLRRDNLACEAYANLWDSLNAKSRPTLPANTASKRYARVKQWLDTHPDTTSWDANPWVWVVEFKRVTA